MTPYALRDTRGERHTRARIGAIGCGLALALGCAGSGSGDPQRDEAGASAAAVEEGPFVVAIAPDAIAAADGVGVDLADLTDDALATIADLLPDLEKVVTIEVDPFRVIPETGIGGSTTPQGEVSLRIKDARFVEADELRVWLPETLAHEAHHSVRIRQGPGYGITLGEKLVSEGLATVFAREVFPETPLQPWAQALTEAEQRALWAFAQPLLDQPLTSAQHSAWFFGASNIPRWTGYTIGVGVVNAYLSSHPGTTAAMLVYESAESITAESGYDP